MKHVRLVVFIAAAALFGSAAPALAEVRTEKFRFPIEVTAYQVKQDTSVGVQKPNVDGFITGMSVDVVDENGEPVSIKRLMLHHIVFSAIGQQSSTCNTFTGLDNKSKISGGFVEQFYAAGEERAVLSLPPGYGYPMKASDPWAMTWMVMNHRARRDSAFVEWTVTYDTDPDLTAVKPVWMDVVNCHADPVYDVPGGRPAGATHKRTYDWTSPMDGRIVAAGGHVHGGGRSLTLSQPDCGDRELYTSRPTWGRRDHPFYNVKPVLHEPGPVNMSGFNSGEGHPVNAGQKVRLTSTYDAVRPHTRVMGIMLMYIAPQQVEDGCPPLADDVLDSFGLVDGRRNPPRFTVPITARRGDGIAREVTRAPGRTFRLRSGDTIFANDFFFNRPNVIVNRGSTLKWRFGRDCPPDPTDFMGAGNRPGCTLHNVTVASGPRGFSSPNLNDGRSFKKKFKKPGKYKLFCALHPVDMTQTVKVRRKKS